MGRALVRDIGFEEPLTRADVGSRLSANGEHVRPCRAGRRRHRRARPAWAAFSAALIAQGARVAVIDQVECRDRTLGGLVSGQTENLMTLVAPTLRSAPNWKLRWRRSRRPGTCPSGSSTMPLSIRRPTLRRARTVRSRTYPEVVVRPGDRRQREGHLSLLPGVRRRDGAGGTRLDRQRRLDLRRARAGSGAL